MTLARSSPFGMNGSFDSDLSGQLDPSGFRRIDGDGKDLFFCSKSFADQIQYHFQVKQDGIKGMCQHLVFAEEPDHFIILT